MGEGVDGGAVGAAADEDPFGDDGLEAAVLDHPVCAAVGGGEDAEIGAEIDAVAARRIDGDRVDRNVWQRAGACTVERGP